MIAEPYVHINGDGWVNPLKKIYRRVGGEREKYLFSYAYDLRVVLAVQGVATLGAISLWVGWNALATTYGG